MRVVDYFAGAGGFTLGAQLAGCEVVQAINHNPVAVDCHARNHPDVRHACEDLTRFDPRRLAEFDILVGGPACQGHAHAHGAQDRPRGKSSKSAVPLAAKWDADRATAWSIIDCAEVRRPRGIAVENIMPFLRWALFPCWLDALRRLNYGVRVNVLNSAAWGVPQDRPRVYVTAIYGAPAPAVVEPILARPAPIGDVIAWGEGVWNPVAEKADATRARVERGRRAFGRRFVMPYNGSGSGLTGRSIERPIGTITAADRWAVVDGDVMRMLSVDELRAAMGFPEGYVLPPTRDAATEALGNAAVPVVAAAAVGAVAEVIRARRGSRMVIQ